MSFGTYARKVRDEALPYRHRVGALRSCVQLYRPIGFNATLGFLEQIAGPYERDEAALIRALDALTESREQWKAEVRRYAEQRRQAKLLGQRSPRPADRNPSNVPDRWYGASRQAALHALQVRRRWGLIAMSMLRDPAAADLNALVTAILTASGELAPDQRELLAGAITQLRRRARSDVGHDSSESRFHAWELLKLARLVESAANPG
ncbi:hypothetical protein [Micromonospora sp. NPDC005113]